MPLSLLSIRTCTGVGVRDGDKRLTKSILFHQLVLIAMSRRRAATLEDPIEHGRMREPPRTWYPIGNNLNSSSQGETRSLSDGSSSEVGNFSTQTRGRGPSLMNASWSTGNNPIKIVLNDRGQPVMPEASSLATNLGVLARDGSLLPLHYTDWRYVPAHYKKRVWEEIKAHTDANDSMERWFMQSLGRKWQGWKCEAKKQGYTPYNNDADRIAHRPSRVTEEQWWCLMYYWNDRDIKENSINNKGYKSQQKLLHTSGRTPHYFLAKGLIDKNCLFYFIVLHSIFLT
ncbi:uncharacterized protein LOC131334080 [Rhododendron vialii]|uniref:uncharacterized protein LOC131334080 n=1 Tax=Rhododendron vialii TaxID=182163 RepID=UPI00265E0097|nr:uncharacterized protein LOC131334080 [Rhododendron vialii]